MIHTYGGLPATDPKRDVRTSGQVQLGRRGAPYTRDTRDTRGTPWQASRDGPPNTNRSPPRSSTQVHAHAAVVAARGADRAQSGRVRPVRDVHGARRDLRALPGKQLRVHTLHRAAGPPHHP